MVRRTLQKNQGFQPESFSQTTSKLHTFGKSEGQTKGMKFLFLNQKLHASSNSISSCFSMRLEFSKLLSFIQPSTRKYVKASLVS